MNKENKEKILSIVGLIILLIFFICARSSFAYDMTFNETVSTNYLPINGTHSINFTVVQNETLSIDIASQSPKLGITTQRSHMIDNNNVYNLLIDWDVNDTLYTQNTTLKADILIQTQRTNKNYSIGVYTFIEKQEPQVFNIVSTSSDDVFRNGTFYKNISILHDFPSKDSLVIDLKGVAGQVFKLSGCDDDWFLACKNSSYTLDNEGKYQLKVPYRMEFTPLGVYNETFYLKSDTKNYTLHAVFRVLQPDFKLSMKLIDGCQDYEDLSFSQQMNCSALLLQYQAEGIIQLNQYFAKISTENICEQFLKTEYVVGDSISKEVLDTNLRLNNNLSTCMNNLFLTNNDLSSCQREKDKIINTHTAELQSKEQEKIDLNNANTKTKLELREQYDTQSKEEVKSTRSFMMWLCFILGILSVIPVLYKYYVENTKIGVTVRINAVIYMIASTFLLLSAVLLLVWG